MEIPDEKRFHFRDGTTVDTLEALKGKLEGISYQEFYRHVNADKNDFANWVRHVLNDEQLAEDLEKVTSIVETVEIINDHLHPLPVEQPHEDIQSKIEEEALNIHVPVEEVPTTHATAEHTGETADLEVIEEGMEEPDDSKPTPETPKHVFDQREYSRLIVKDFMYGLVFGLIIGLILGRILTF